jgi:hypothetical protein
MQLNLFLLSAALLANAAIAIDPVNLRTAENYAILTKTGISTVPYSSITGDIAVSPIAATAITGFGLALDSGGQLSSASQVYGNAYAADYAVPTPTTLTSAVSDMETAYSDAEARTNADTTRNDLGNGAIGGKTLTTGVHFGADISLSSDVTFSGSATDIFIVQTTGNMSLAGSTKVLLAGNAKAENIFWQVAGHVTVGPGAQLEGILLVKTDVLFETGSSLNGRVFAQTACNLQSASITEPA